MWHNVSHVIGFEFGRTLRKPTFWLTTLGLPLLIVAFMAMSIMSGATAGKASFDRSKPVLFTYTDASGLVDESVAAKSGGTPTADPEAAKAAVIAGSAELFIAYPADPSAQSIAIVARDAGLFDNAKYTAIARTVLEQSAQSKVQDARVAAVLTKAPSTDLQVFKEGRPAPGPSSMIAPALFIAAFIVGMMLLGNQVVVMTVEEKENRVTEMILTTIKPTALIVGKLISVVLLGIVQAVALLGLTSVGLFIFGPKAAISTGEVSLLGTLEISPTSMVVGALLFVGSFLLAIGVLCALGSMMPTAKEANNAFGGIVLAFILPLYLFGAYVDDPDGVLSSVLTFFPLTAPITAMARNALGTLGPQPAATVIVEMFAFAALFLYLGVILFKKGAMSYDVRLNLRKVLSRRG